MSGDAGRMCSRTMLYNTSVATLSGAEGVKATDVFVPGRAVASLRRLHIGIPRSYRSFRRMNVAQGAVIFDNKVIKRRSGSRLGTAREPMRIADLLNLTLSGPFGSRGYGFWRVL
jgi:hypothetical protein